MTEQLAIRGPRLAFTVPGTPVPKGRARSWMRNGKLMRPFTPARTKAYMAHVRLCAQRALTSAALSHTWPLSEQYDISLRIFVPDRRTRDTDNIEKAVTDACNKLLWRDDRLLGNKWISAPAVDRANPRVEVVVDVVYRGGKR